jgi:hypothetical protein
VLTGYIIGTFDNYASGVTSEGAAPFECDFSGDTGRLTVLLWRTHVNNGSIWFAIERTLNPDGSANGGGVTVRTASANTYCQQTLTDYDVAPLVLRLRPRIARQLVERR